MPCCLSTLMPHQSYHYYKNIDPNWLSMIRWFPLPCVVLFVSTCLDRKIFYFWVWFDLTCLAPGYFFFIIYLLVYLFINWYRAWISVHLVLIISTQDFIHLCIDIQSWIFRIHVFSFFMLPWFLVSALWMCKIYRHLPLC